MVTRSAPARQRRTSARLPRRRRAAEAGSAFACLQFLVARITLWIRWAAFFFPPRRILFAWARITVIQTGSIALWDNRCVQHYAVPDFSGSRRLYQVTIEAPLPVAVVPDADRAAAGRDGERPRSDVAPRPSAY